MGGCMCVWCAAAAKWHSWKCIWLCLQPVGQGPQTAHISAADLRASCCAFTLLLYEDAVADLLPWLMWPHAPRSAGMLRLRSPEWGGAWVQHLDAPAARAATGSEAPLWPAWLEGGSLMAVVNSSKAPHPQVRCGKQMQLRGLEPACVLPGALSCVPRCGSALQQAALLASHLGPS